MCRVIAFEPVPHFHAFLEYSTHYNGLAQLIDRRTNVVGMGGIMGTGFLSAG